MHDLIRDFREVLSEYIDGEKAEPGSIHPMLLASYVAMLNALDRLEDAEHAVKIANYSQAEAGQDFDESGAPAKPEAPEPEVEPEDSDEDDESE